MPDDLAGSRLRRAALAGVAFVAYVGASVLIFGRGVLEALDTRVVGDDGADKTIFIWSLKWWPSAIAAWHDPLDADVVWVPGGTDLSWATTVPLLSVLATPLTELTGPVTTYNILILCAPALSGLAAYCLAHRLTRSFWPSLVAGWLFGFSAFEIGHMIGHLNLASLCLVPLVALLLVGRLDGTMARPWFIGLLALVLTAQFLTSTEIFVTVLLVSTLFGVVAIALDPSLRASVRAVSRDALAATICTLVVVSPYLWHAFVLSGVEHAPLRSPYSAATDLLNFVTPTRRIWLQLPGSEAIASTFTANGAERGGYLGLPVLIVVALFLVKSWRSPRRRVVAVTLAVLVVASMGASIRIAGHGVLPGPWKVPASLPITRTVLPIRLTLFVSLIVAMIVAVWLAERSGSWARWSIVVLGIVFLFPNPSARLWRADVPNPEFFRTAAHKSALERGSAIVITPFGPAGWSLLWQAETNFHFRLVGGHFGRRVTPAERSWRAAYETLAHGTGSTSGGTELRRFLRAHDVARVIVAADTNPAVERALSEAGLRVVGIGGGVKIYSDPPSLSPLPRLHEDGATRSAE